MSVFFELRGCGVLNRKLLMKTLCRVRLLGFGIYPDPDVGHVLLFLQSWLEVSAVRSWKHLETVQEHCNTVLCCRSTCSRLTPKSE